MTILVAIFQSIVNAKAPCACKSTIQCVVHATCTSYYSSSQTIW